MDRPPAQVQVWDRELAELLKQTNKEKPKPADVERLRALLREKPELWKAAGNLARFARDEAIQNAGRLSQGVQESVRRGALEMERQLGYREAPPLEQLLIRQIVICWIQLYDVQTRYSLVHGESGTYAQSQHWERRLTAVQRRFLKAVGALAKVRKLTGGKLIQVNIAEQQVNVLSEGSTPVEPKKQDGGRTP